MEKVKKAVQCTVLCSISTNANLFDSADHVIVCGTDPAFVIPGINSRNRFRQTGNRLLGSLKGLQKRALIDSRSYVLALKNIAICIARKLWKNDEIILKI